MNLIQKIDLRNLDSFIIIKSFLIWSFSLIVCLLIVGFPVIIFMATFCALASIILQTFLPTSSVLLVVGTLLSLNLLIIFTSAAILTIKGIHPQEVHWLRWLNGKGTHINTSVYASCPLTCDIA